MGEVVEEPLHVEPHLLLGAAAGSRRRALAGELIQIGALVVIETQDARERGEDRRGRVDPSLLEAGVVVGADRGELRDLLPSKARNTPMRPTLGQADLARRQLGTARLQECAQARSDRPCRCSLRVSLSRPLVTGEGG